MLASKRFLPSLSMLSIFEAAVRTGSFSAAAEELSLTQSAVSRQIKKLEHQLDNTFFIRNKQNVHVTSAGKEYAEVVREALLLIADASLNLKANPGSGTLNLAISPSLGSYWLIPKLPEFLKLHPDIKINLTTEKEPFLFQKENIDIVLHYGMTNWFNSEALFLMKEKMVPVCSQQFLDTHVINSPDDMLHLPLLHLTIRSDAWERWFTEQGVPFTGLTGMLFDQFSTVLAAAKCGMGMALIPDFVLHQEVNKSSIVMPSTAVIENEEAYYLVYPKDSSNIKPIMIFYDWLTDLINKK